MDQYLENKTLEELIPISDFNDLRILSTDSYSDSEIWKTIKQKNGSKILLYCAIQTAVIGFGNKVYGQFEYNEEKIDVKSVYKEYGVRYDLTLQSKIEPGELTPRRLQRFYRTHIHKYLERNSDVYPYLWKKYSNMDVKYRSITFPGAESFVESKDEALYLLETYKNLDMRLNTNISERIKRVLVARGIIKPYDVKDVNT